MRDLLLFLHILGVAGWIGGGLFAMYGIGRLAGAGGASNGRAIEIIVEKAGIYFTVMSLLVIGAGIGLVITDEQWGWGDAFVWVGIGAILVSGAWQGLVSTKKQASLLDAVKSESPNRVAALSAWRRTSWVEVAVLFVAVWAMVAKL